ISKLSDCGSFVYLREDGEDCRECDFPENPIFVLGDNKDLTEEEESTLLARSPSKISVGPSVLHADHCIIIIHNELDRRSSAAGNSG
ncbi:MAG: tRNA (pseudouridine(54)-N(1))-methyltransferase TrmY, partial [Candidatus Methanoplasma sp.]|nr:tRNA (pseudouridine(54)-N(1))-methyltransferase TrmY [Candidatus Methanoplasma sp.]